MYDLSRKKIRKYAQFFMTRKIINNLSELRGILGKEKAISQAAFAGKIGVPIRTYINIEKGKSKLTETILLAIEYIYGARKEWILTGKGEIFKEFDESDYHKAPLVKKIMFLDEQFYLIYNSLKQLGKVSSDAGCARLLRITPQAFSQIKNKKRFPEKRIRTFCKENDLSFDDFISGRIVKKSEKEMSLTEKLLKFRRKEDTIEDERYKVASEILKDIFIAKDEGVIEAILSNLLQFKRIPKEERKTLKKTATPGK